MKKFTVVHGSDINKTVLSDELRDHLIAWINPDAENDDSILVTFEHSDFDAIKDMVEGNWDDDTPQEEKNSDVTILRHIKKLMNWMSKEKIDWIQLTT